MTAHQGAAQAAVEVGARIHQAMWRRKVSQVQLAGVLGVTQGVVSRKLRGASPITVSELFTIASALGVDVVDLVGNAASPDTLAVSGPAVSLPRLDSNQQPSGYQSAQVRAWAYWRASRAASGASLAVAS